MSGFQAVYGICVSVSNGIILSHHMIEVREKVRPRQDLNPQSLAPRASTLSIRSHGALPMSYAAVKFMQANLVHAILQVYKFIASKFANRRNQKMPCPDKSGYCRGESCQGQTFLNSPRISSFIFEIDFQLR